MEELNSRFEHISEQTFNQLDNKSLANCREVSSNWYHFLEERKFLNIRIILKIALSIKGMETENKVKSSLVKSYASS